VAAALVAVNWEWYPASVSETRDQHVRVGFAGRDGVVERLWATRVGPNLYRLDNAPAFAFGISLHDIVEVVRDDDGAFWALRVAERGPSFTVRVVLDELRPRTVRLMRMLAALGCSSEGMEATWFVVSAPNDASFRHLVARLATDGYRWEYVNPKRADVASPDPSAALDRLVPPDIDASTQAILHLDAPWKDRADDELEVLATVNPGKQRPELLPARRIDDRLWELCSSPFLADGFALGDIVEADSTLRLLRRVSRSGRGAILGFVEHAEQVEDVRTRLVTLGCVVERRSSAGSLAIDCATPEVFDRASTWLAGQSELSFEVLQTPRRHGEHSES
jgi:hypothetical protein